MRIDGQHVKIDGHAHAAGKGHFAHGCQQTAVGAVMVGQYMTLRSQLADDLEEGTQRDRVVDIRNSLAYLIEGLRQNGSAQTLLTKTQIDKNKCSVAYVGSQLRRQRGAHIDRKSTRLNSSH